MEKIKFYKKINKHGYKEDKSFERYFSNNPKHSLLKSRLNKIQSYIVGQVILDIGCSSGITCYLASKKNNITEIHGLDIQKSILEKARKNVKNDKVSFHHGFSEKLPFENDYFDTVILTETLEHVYDDKKTIIEANRVLKFDGRIIITVPNEGKISGTHVRTFNTDILKVLLKPYFNINVLYIDKYLYCVAKKNSE